MVVGKTLRETLPRESHSGWKPPVNRPDPIGLLEESNRHRLPELIPIRYGRMLHSPSTFLRGSAGLMAHDLAATPVPACGCRHAGIAIC
jgi:hypothetical protein